ncbi:MAG: UDP-N-acetylmuramate:L-alanyl-gamma-D-glutamyl-meso-diaminopimelate ligase [Proteobacteria bacterium]|nr:UDP-N-acetylmuramate:L-alanyl-gamma-D-glutamyl-meso-diaminopimelate ligase [Pseudomonadota bacterium]
MKTIYMVGICGTGMGNLAIMLKKQGYNVIGSDLNVYPPMSTVLENAGVKILQGYKEENIKELPDIAIIGNVVRRDNPEAQLLINKGVKYYSMPQALSEFFFKDKTTVVVTGTHGKTTTSFMAAWLLENAGKKPGFFIGGVPKDFETMGRPAQGDYFVIEGDEYDTAFFDKAAKFFHYKPQYLIINCIEFDHADIYPDLQSIKNAFGKLISMMPKDGVIIYNAQDKNIKELLHLAKCKIVSFSADGKTKADYQAHNIKVIHGDIAKNIDPKLNFDVTSNGKKEIFTLGVPGVHNVLNAVAVIALSHEMNLNIDTAKKSLSSFKGVKRRQEVYGVAGGRIIIDDFAHHPTAMSYTIDAIKEWYYPRKIWCLFEARSATSRTNILQDEVIEALSKAQRLILPPVHQPERVEESKRFNPEYVCKVLRERGVDARTLGGVDEIVDYLSRNTASGDVILIMSNGGFGGIYEKLMHAF